MVFLIVQRPIFHNLEAQGTVQKHKAHTDTRKHANTHTCTHAPPLLLHPTPHPPHTHTLEIASNCLINFLQRIVLRRSSGKPSFHFLGVKNPPCYKYKAKRNRLEHMSLTIIISFCCSERNRC